jgi:hypothetical protein
LHLEAILTIRIPNSYFQIDFVCGPIIDRFGPSTSNIFYSAQNRLLTADNGGTQAYLTNAASLSGYVYRDANNDGKKASSEAGLGNVTVILSGTDSLGKAVSLTVLTKPDGSFYFHNLRAGTYSLSFNRLSGVRAGKTTVGTVSGRTNGRLKSGRVEGIVLTLGDHGIDYLFGVQGVNPK